MESVEYVPLLEENLRAIPERPGVYMLRHLGIPVYVGKADDSVPLRLSRHHRTLTGRRHLSIEDMTFRCITFDSTWNPLRPEEYLIEHYETGERDGWNDRGFGSNEPGENRGQTHLKAGNFYKRFPLRDDWPCATLLPGEYACLDLPRAIKAAVPFYFKFQGNRVEGSRDKRNR